MIELVQFPWSPYCLVQKRILDFSAVPYKIVNIAPSDRSLVWRLTKERYYQVPILKDGKTVVFETEENSQVIAKYLESKFQLSLFPPEWDGIQKLIWRYIENDVEAATFRLNDAYYREFVPPSERLQYVRFKERKFGRGCLDQWLEEQKLLLTELTERLLPFEQMLNHKTFLLGEQPRFLDFDLWGMLANFLYSGHYSLPVVRPEIKKWFGRMTKLKYAGASREKLYS
jgi:glutathione S-transferase